MTDIVNALAPNRNQRGTLLPLDFLNGISGHENRDGTHTTNAFVKKVGDELHVVKLDNHVLISHKHRTPVARISTNEKRETNITRAKVTLRNRIVHNWPRHQGARHGVHFITLTYKGALTSYAQIQNRAEHIKDLMHFIRNVNRRYSTNLRYDWVYELQTKYGRDAAHFHIVVYNMPWNNVKELQALWNRNCVKGSNLGNLDITRKTNKRTTAWYLAGYLAKGLSDQQLSGKHLHGGSKGLLHPESTSAPDRASALVADAYSAVARLQYQGQPFLIPFFNVTATRYVFIT